MKKAKKILALLLCAVLLVCASVAGTLAFLTQQTKTVQNTFTVGNVSLGTDADGDGLIDNGLDETKVDEYGVAVAGAARVTENTYKLIPGHSYTKDPTIHVAAGSEEAYLFVTVVNEIAAIEDGTTIAAQMAANGWVALDGVENTYYLNRTVNTLEATGVTDVNVFASFTLKGDAAVADYANAKITVVAYAVQADGFATAAAAWAAANFGA